MDAYWWRIGNDYVEAIIYANQLTNRLGIGTNNVRDIIGFMTELFEKGIIDEKVYGRDKIQMGRSRVLGEDDKDDRLLERFLKEPTPTGPCKRHVVKLDEMLRGYDQNGYPSYEKPKSSDPRSRRRTQHNIVRRLSGALAGI